MVKSDLCKQVAISMEAKPQIQLIQSQKSEQERMQKATRELLLLLA